MEGRDVELLPMRMVRDKQCWLQCLRPLAPLNLIGAHL